MSADERIPVTEETRQELHNLKEPGQTYDDLLAELAQMRRRHELEDRFRGLEVMDRDDLTRFPDG